MGPERAVAKDRGDPGEGTRLLWASGTVHTPGDVLEGLRAGKKPGRRASPVLADPEVRGSSCPYGAAASSMGRAPLATLCS